MPSADTDQYWQSIGRNNPYWGVLSHPTWSAENLTDDAIEDLYETGETHINSVFEIVRKHLDESFAPTSALDFGCGVGRLVIPLAKRGLSVVGVDVSDGMLAQARARCQSLGLSNVRLLCDSGQLELGSAQFDLVHTFIVFQHITCSRGLAIAKRILARLREGGVGVLHFSYYMEPATSWRRLDRLWRWLDRWGLSRVGQVLRGVKHVLYEFVARWGRGKRQMQSHLYNLNAILQVLQQAGIRRFHVELTHHGRVYGVVLFFQKRHQDSYLL
jgi:ubiquinone/menaquinone biosynthesis C-methylase UbiE